MQKGQKMKNNQSGGLDAKQGKYLVSFIIEYVDKNSYHLPTQTQIFESKQAELTKLGITKEKIKRFYKSKSYKNIRDIKERFAKNAIRKNFGSFAKFYQWYLEQLKKQDYRCYYCNTPKCDLEQIFERKYLIDIAMTKEKPYSTKPSISAALHIDKKELKGKYGDNDNCVLVCTLCKNAKKDMVHSGDNFGWYYGGSIYEFYKEMLGLAEYDSGGYYIDMSIDE